MALDAANVIDRVASHASSTALFQYVQKHEPKSAPNNGLHYAVYVSGLSPVALASGLAATSVRLELTGRIYHSFISEPEDEIDPDLTNALDILFTAYSGDFELGGAARNIDLLGAHGAPLSARSGYLRIDSKIFRVMDIIIPIIINDAFEQVG